LQQQTNKLHARCSKYRNYTHISTYVCAYMWSSSYMAAEDAQTSRQDKPKL